MEKTFPTWVVCIHCGPLDNQEIRFGLLPHLMYSLNWVPKCPSQHSSHNNHPLQQCTLTHLPQLTALSKGLFRGSGSPGALIIWMR